MDLSGWVCCQFIPRPPEGIVATSLLTGRPASSPLLSTGPTDGFSCHVSPSMLMAVQGGDRQKEGRAAVRRH